MLGQVLYHAALLSEAMDCSHEEKLLAHYLMQIPGSIPGGLLINLTIGLLNNEEA